ncbi:MAG: aldehyde ferredoxin oxidoreductase C-terminal domain-containing protein [Bacillota bacterium]
MQKFLRVDVRKQTVNYDPVPDEYKLLGGRGLTARILLDEVDARCSPLGENNKIIFAPGILGGTKAPCTGRLSVGAKSPLTQGVKESNAGGTAGHKIARLGIKAIIVEGKPSDDWFIVVVNKDGARLELANELVNLGNYELSEKLRERFGKKVSIISIGQAGEYCLPVAGVAVSDLEGKPNRYAGRGGMGAVMGAKHIKAIVLDDSGTEGVSYHDKDTFSDICKHIRKGLAENQITGNVFPQYGTSVNIQVVNALGAIPTKNFRYGSYEHAEMISGEKMHDVIMERGGEGKTTHPCMPGCPIMCSNIYPDEQGKTIVAPMEYETMAMFGSNLDIPSLDGIAHLNKLCNDYGIDTIEMGVTLGVAMDGGILAFGDVEKCKELITEISKGTLVGRLLGQGAEILAKVLGAERVPAFKGQGIPAYDPRALKGNIPLYATSPMGADHTCGNSLRVPDPLSPKGKVKASRKLQIGIANIDNLGLCMFAGLVVGGRPDWIKSLVESRYGIDVPDTFVEDIGKEVLTTELVFNERAGFTKDDNRVPEFLQKEPLPPHNTVCDISHEEIRQCLDFGTEL